MFNAGIEESLITIPVQTAARCPCQAPTRRSWSSSPSRLESTICGSLHQNERLERFQKNQRAEEKIARKYLSPQ